MNKTLKATVFGVAALATATTDALAADRRPENIPEMTDQIPNASLGRVGDNGWRYVMNNGQYIVDQGNEKTCPGVLITKHGVDKDGRVASLFSLATLPYGKEYDLDVMHHVSLESGKAEVNGDRKYDYTGNTLAVDAQFISADVIPGNADYIDLKTPRQECKVVSNPDGSVTIEPPGEGTGGCQQPPCNNGPGDQGPGNNPEEEFDPNASAEKYIMEKVRSVNGYSYNFDIA